MILGRPIPSCLKPHLVSLSDSHRSAIRTQAPGSIFPLCDLASSTVLLAMSTKPRDSKE
jgi:hypothetical protein